MMCPVCKKAMIVVEHHQIELDYCTNCYGAWFDSGELELLLESAGLEGSNLVVKNMLSLPGVKPSHGGRKCPLCGHGMKETSIGQPSINIDVCRQGDGLWFDGGELQELLKQLAGKPLAEGSSEQRILAFLGEVFKVPE